MNDFSLHVATANGSGSQSSNNVLMKAIFRMGIPVSGKNLFPSNIQGLPTWFSIRVNEDGYLARDEEHHLLVCMNPATFKEDIEKADAGSIVILHDSMKNESTRKDLTFFEVPFKDLIAKACPEVRLRKLAVNMVYVGLIAEMIGLEDEAINEALSAQFKTKKKVIDLNASAIEAGRVYVREELKTFESHLKLKRANKTKGKILIEGNTAAALGAVFGGCQFFSWYPITPSSSLAEAFSEYADRTRTDAAGKKNFAMVQAEDELSAIGMVIGASWMGGRAMTCTSGPGISLMAEFSGLGYFAEIPSVVWDVQRVGPSTGLPTRTAQQDVLFTAVLSHGDTKQVCLYPGSVQECFEFGKTALDLAEQLQTPIFVLSDLDLGMNSWMSDPFEYPTEALKRGKVLKEEDVEQIKTFARYKDVDGDGICYRTLPGNKHSKSVYFTRGTGHNESSGYTESSETFEKLLDRLTRKFETARNYVPQSVFEKNNHSKIGIIAYGSSHGAVCEAVDLLQEGGVAVDYLRVRAYPFCKKVDEFLEAHDQVFVVEQNRDAQLRSLLAMEQKYKNEITKVESILHYDGMPLSARTVVSKIDEKLSSQRNAS